MDGVPPIRAATEASGPSRLRVHYGGTRAAALLAGALVSATLPSGIFETPPTCRWCDGANPNALDRFASEAKWGEPCRAARLSNLSLSVSALVGLVPMSRESSAREWLENTGVVADSVAVTVMATQLTKYAVRRERPSSNPCLKQGSKEQDHNLSFFSGHTAIAFALIASAEETARMRGRSVNNWRLVGGSAAALTAYLRIAGNRHHLTDVIIGAGVGYAIGTWVPRHLHSRASSDSAASAAASAPPISLLGYAKSPDSRSRMVVHIGKGPGKSVTVNVSF